MNIEREIHFSDAAASQFKSKTPFADVAHCIEDFGFHAEKTFFGTGHGKRPCDEEFEVMKRTSSNAVLTRKAFIRSTEFSKKCLCKPQDKNAENLCQNARRTFFNVKEKDINRNRPDRTNVKPISETRKVHAVRMGKDLHVTFAKLFYECCAEGAEEVEGCLNKLHVRRGHLQEQEKKNSLCQKMILSKKLFKRKNTQVDIYF